MASNGICPACAKPGSGDDACACPPCRACGRPRAVCFEPVDQRFPARAREAYAEVGYTYIPTCLEGQARDLKVTTWCWDRARFDKYWTGTAMSPEERRGFKPAEAL